MIFLYLSVCFLSWGDKYPIILLIYLLDIAVHHLTSILSLFIAIYCNIYLLEQKKKKKNQKTWSEYKSFSQPSKGKPGLLKHHCKCRCCILHLGCSQRLWQISSPKTELRSLGLQNFSSLRKKRKQTTSLKTNIFLKSGVIVSYICAPVYLFFF